jgi:hypothetical protein
MFLAHLAKGNVSFLPSLGVCRPLTFHILIFSSETPQPNEPEFKILISSEFNKNKNCMW